MLFFQTLVSLGQFKKDSSLANNQSFGALGTSLFGYDNNIKSHFSVYWQTGTEYNITKYSKLGFAFSLLKFNWTGFQQNTSTFTSSYDKLNYFSISGDIQLFGREIISRSKDVDNCYDKYIEYGIGYNCPYYFTLSKYNNGVKTEEIYPNKYNDIYVYSTFYFLEPFQIPLGVKLEYHPFDFITSNDYPDMAKFRIDVLISLFTPNNDKR